MVPEHYHPDCIKSLPGSSLDMNYKENNNSFNTKDGRGEFIANLILASVVITVLLAILLIMITVLPKRSISKPFRLTLYVSLITGLVVCVFLISYTSIRIRAEPILVLYAASQLVAKMKRTPAVMVPTTDTEKSIVYDLQSNFDNIKSEIYYLLERNQPRLANETFSGQNLGIGSDIRVECDIANEECTNVGWELFTVNLGKHITEQSAECLPTLVGIIKKYKGDLLATTISILPGKTHIPPHVGYSSFVKRLMLGIEIPEATRQCYLCVNGIKQTWTERETILWDDTFCHSVYNETSDRRIVVYMDIRRYTGNRFVDLIGDKVLNLLENSELIRDEIKATERKLKI